MTQYTMIILSCLSVCQSECLSECLRRDRYVLFQGTRCTHKKQHSRLLVGLGVGVSVGAAVGIGVGVSVGVPGTGAEVGLGVGVSASKASHQHANDMKAKTAKRHCHQLDLAWARLSATALVCQSGSMSGNLDRCRRK